MKDAKQLKLTATVKLAVLYEKCSNTVGHACTHGSQLPAACTSGYTEVNPQRYLPQREHVLL